jgi:hypothetical protein
MPSGPDPKTFLDWTGRAATIVGDMFKSLKEGGTFLASAGSKLKIPGILLTQLVRFALPKSLWSVLARYWLGLLFLASVILILFGPFKSAEVATVGWMVLGLTVALAVIRQMLGDYLTEGSWWKRTSKMLGIGVAVLLLLLVFGAGVRSILIWFAGHKEWFVDFLPKLLTLLHLR